MNILFLSALPIWSGGTNRSGGPAFSRTVEWYLDQGHRLHLITTEAGNENLALSGMGVTVVGKRWIASSDGWAWRMLGALLLFPVAAAAAFLSFRRRFQPDIIYGYEVEGILAASLLRRFCRRPMVSRFQGTVLAPVVLGAASLRDKIYRLPHMLAFRVQADLAIVTDDGTLGDQVLRKLNPALASRMRFWRNGIDRVESAGPGVNLREILGLSPGTAVLMTLSRLAAWKRVDRAVHALALLRRSGLDAELVVVGDGPERKNLERLASELGLPARVHFQGAVPHSEVPAYLRQADIFLSLYDLSNLGNPLMEAMRAGLPIVTIANGGTASVVRDGWNACALPTGEPEEVAAALRRLIPDRETQARLGENARAFAQKEFWAWKERLRAEGSAVEDLVRG